MKNYTHTHTAHMSHTVIYTCIANNVECNELVQRHVSPGQLLRYLIRANSVSNLVESSLILILYKNVLNLWMGPVYICYCSVLCQFSWNRSIAECIPTMALSFFIAMDYRVQSKLLKPPEEKKKKSNDKNESLKINQPCPPLTVALLCKNWSTESSMLSL